MYNILIIEDEIPARKKLKTFINKLNIDYTIIAEIDTVTEVVSFLESSTKIDLIFSDIELKDANVFNAYNTLHIQAPIIFTTAYDTFLLDAFDKNGIGYLLKPYSFEKFKNAWNKFINLNTKLNIQQELIQQLNSHFNTPQYSTKLMVKNTKEIYFLNLSVISYFKAEDGVVFAHDNTNKKHLLNFNTLSQLQKTLNPKDFFLINRSEIVQKNAILKLTRYDKNSFIVKLKHIELKTSQSKTSGFYDWIQS